MNNNLVGQEPWELRGANDARIRALETTVALLQTGAWTNWTPTLSATTTAPTFGAGATQLGRYVDDGRMITGNFIIYFGGAGLNQGAGSYRLVLPTPPRTAASDHLSIGTGYVYDTSTNTYASIGLFLPTSNTDADIIVDSAGAAPVFVGANVPWPWAVGDRILGHFSYEAAS